MGLIAIAVAALAYLLFDDGEDEAEAPPIELAEENDFTARKLGVSGSAPEGWAVRTNDTHVEAASLSGLGRVVVTVPGPANRADKIFREAVDALKLVFESVEKGRTMRDALIDERPTRSALIALRRRDGREVQAAVAVAQGVDDAYLVEVFITEGAPARRITEAQAMLDSLELTG